MRVLYTGSISSGSQALTCYNRTRATRAINAINEGVIMRLQCIIIKKFNQNNNFFLPTYPNFFSEVIRNTLINFFGLSQKVWDILQILG